MNRRPTIILDIAPLGYAFENPSAARGIHRVCQRLFQGLLEARECDLRFVATSDLAATHAFLSKEHPSLLPNLYYKKGHLVLSDWARRIKRWIARTLHNRNVFYRVTRFILHHAARWAGSRSRQLPAEVMTGAQIYHSSLAPIPSVVLANGNLCHFITIHDLLPLTDPASMGRRGRRDIRRIIEPLTRESFAFCTGPTVGRDLVEHSRIRPERIFVTPLAADSKIFYPVNDPDKLSSVRAKYGILDQPYFLSLSSFDPRKNFGHVIECFARLAGAGELEQNNLVIVGSNPERNSFVAEATSRYPKLQSRIFLVGFVHDEDLAAIYSGALAFLFPSLAEGFGMPALEAMRCGTPVISSNAPVIPEVLGDAGILLDPRDIDGWRKAMIRIASDSDLRENLTIKGFERASCFSWDYFIQETIRGYNEALTV